MSVTLDPVDVNLLEWLQKDNLLTADQLAERVGRSPSAVARRLRRLRDIGAVSSNVSVISDEAAGSPLFAVVLVQMEHHALQGAQALMRRLVASENVQFCFEISGPFDMMLVMVAADMDAYNLAVDRLVGEQPGVRRYETSFVKKRGKATLALPLKHLLVDASSDGSS